MIVENAGAFHMHGLEARRWASRTLRRIAWLVPMTVLSSVFSAHAEQAQGTIRIGVPAPLSGSFQDAGVDVVNGAKLAVDRINAMGGVLGKQLELVQQDDACDPDRAAIAAKDLVAAGVVAVAGGYCSSATVPELNIFHAEGVPYVLDASTFPRLTDQGWHDVFRTIGRTDTQGSLAASFIRGQLRANRVAVVNDGTAYSLALARSTVAALKRDDVQVVYDDSITPGQGDYRAIAKVVADMKPDVFYFTGYYPEAAKLARDVRDTKELVKHFMGGGAADPSLIQTGGTAVAGMIVTTSPLPQFLRSPGALRFIKAYTDAYKHPPGPYSIYEYDAIGVTAQAIESAKSTQPAAIAAALHKIRHYDGATGRIGFDDKGDRMGAAYMAVVVRDGKFEPYAYVDERGHWVPAK